MFRLWNAVYLTIYAIKESNLVGSRKNFMWTYLTVIAKSAVFPDALGIGKLDSNRPEGAGIQLKMFSCISNSSDYANEALY